MSTHVEAHCKTPDFSRKNPTYEGALWACECGQVWRLSKDGGVVSTTGKAVKRWVKFSGLEEG